MMYSQYSAAFIDTVSNKLTDITQGLNIIALSA